MKTCLSRYVPSYVTGRTPVPTLLTKLKSKTLQYKNVTQVEKLKMKLTVGKI